MTIRKPYSKIKYEGLSFPDDGRTHQSFKNDCNINQIMKKYRNQGYAPQVQPGQYGIATGVELYDAQLLVAEAKTMFEELPSEIRNEFQNDPVKLLDFVNDEKNLEAMYEMGLAERPTPTEIDQVKNTINPAQQDQDQDQAVQSATPIDQPDPASEAR